MEKVKEKLGMGHHHKEHHGTTTTGTTHSTGETFAAEHMPKQYETRTETVEKVPQMRKEHQTEYVPRMHERQEEVEVPVHKVVMEKQTRTVNEMRNEPVQREVAVPTGEYKERVVDHNRHPGYVDTGVDQGLDQGERRHHHMGTGHTGGVGGDVNYGTERTMGSNTTGMGSGVNYGKDSGLDTHQTTSGEDAYPNLHGSEHKSTMQKIKEAVIPGSKKEY